MTFENLHVKVIHREGETVNSEFLAVCFAEGQPPETARLASGPSQRAACQEAVNAYFTAKREAYEAVGGFRYKPPVPPQQRWADAPALPIGPTILAKRASVLPEGMLELLHKAKAEDAIVAMTYSDSNDNVTERRIRVTSIEHKPRPGAPFKREDTLYIGAVDLDKGEPRSFRLDRFKSVEIAG